MPEVKLVGHKGADLIVPGNTAASFDAALAHGCHMIEFDVLPEVYQDPGGSRLVLSHDYTHDVTEAPSFEDGLRHLTQPAFVGVEFDVDLKIPGYEHRVVEVLREFDLLDRTLISTMYVESLRRIRGIDPSIRIGWSVPKARRDYTLSPIWKVPTAGAIKLGQAVLPHRVATELKAGRCDAIMCFWRLVTPRLVEAVAGAGGELYVWTVDDARRIERFRKMGVTGVITNDPRLFGQVMSQTAAL
jgi:glycerophosphoryl diester phosphodiesterase